ncbi:hypothetical protein NQ314_019713 [Rhamnusium bicolor]|uniref:c-Myc-binding protein n=1 Tax=Rhamnusium bicolor TaxID=1586634 RepID=A0AAV8WNT2_9CUCU|nr:hypothetical protein NQ314_019713 [Rhamnusium bicolor]
MTTPTYKPSEGKREEFRKYLEKNGIMDALTKVLVNLYEEVDKPENALLFILDKLSIQAGLETNKQLTDKLEEANNRIKELEDDVEQLRNAQQEVAQSDVKEEPGDAPPEDQPPPEQ